MQFLKFWGEAIYASLSIGWVVLGTVSTAMPVIFYFLGKHWPSLLQIPWFKWCVEHQNELHAGMAVAVVVIYVFYAPFVSWSREHSARIEAEAKVAGEPRIKLDVMDAEGRKELEKTRKELATNRDELTKAQETIRALDPLQQRIASATATARVLIKSDENDGTSSHTLGGGGMVAFARGTEALLFTTAVNMTSHTEKNQKTIYLVFTSPVYGPLVGKPITELAASEYMQLEMMDNSLGDGDVLGGIITFTLNGVHRFEFPIPTQSAIEQKKILVRDLHQMRSQLKQN